MYLPLPSSQRQKAIKKRFGVLGRGWAVVLDKGVGGLSEGRALWTPRGQHAQDPEVGVRLGHWDG